MKMKIPSIVFLIIILLFSYQNCSQKNLTAVETEGQTEDSRRSLSDIQVQQVKFASRKQSEVQKSANTFYVMTNVQYSLDPENGVLAEYDEAAETFATYCLTEDLMVEVRNIISNSDICKSPVAPPQTICTTQVILPYAELVTSNEVIRLGGHPCPGGIYDFCGDQSNSLKNWIDAVRGQLPQLGCSN
ncbi:MAG: hypothetical protein V4654_09880 [Bdellovibrionota bacterium]